MESNNSLQAELKKLKQELTSYKIELHHARGYLQCILQSSEDMIFATEIGGMLISFSKGGEKVLGYGWEELIGRHINELAVDQTSFQQFITTSMQDGSTVQMDIPFRHKEGNTVFCSVTLIELTNRENQRVATVGVCRDITLWKKLQEDLVRIDRLAEIGRLAAGVAHEINNPLAIIGQASGWAAEVIEDARGLGAEDRKELAKAVKGLRTVLYDQTSGKGDRSRVVDLSEYHQKFGGGKSRYTVRWGSVLLLPFAFLLPEARKPRELPFDFPKMTASGCGLSA